MPTTLDGSCPYCGGAAFYANVTVEEEPGAQWLNRCLGCDGWSRNVVLPDGTNEQREVPEAEWPA